MKFALKAGLTAAALLTLSATSFALAAQPQPPGVSVPNANTPSIAPTANACDAVRPNAANPLSASSMDAHTGATGAALNAGAAAPGEKCGKTASSMGAAAPTAPATH